jgi:hypothetical protein
MKLEDSKITASEEKEAWVIIGQAFWMRITKFLGTAP